MRGVSDLYEELLLDHARRPRNHRRLDKASVVAHGENPLCGDHCTVYLVVEGDRIDDICFEGAGCAILLASASLMTLAVGGKTRDQAHALVRQFQALLTATSTPEMNDLGDLAVLAGVREYPGRVKCATLPWHTLRAALEGTARS